MKIFKIIKKGLLNKRVLTILFFLITFFPCFKNSDAAYFNYADFDFEAFAEKNKDYWTTNCTRVSDDESEKCIETILNRQKMYYTRLYALLAKYQKKGFLINDNIIIMTSFFDLDPDLFADDSEYYRNVMGSDFTAYNVDANTDMKNYDINQDDNNIDIFENETDTLKLLAKAMIGYSYVCYGSFGKPSLEEAEDGTKVSVCNNGGSLINNECLGKVDSGYMGFWDHLMANKPVLAFFGIKPTQEKDCETSVEEGPYTNGYKFEKGRGAEVAEAKYWEFLETGEYFDRKSHLQTRYSRILNLTGHNQMSELTLEEKEEYNEEIIQVRKRIISEIKELLDNYGAGNINTFYTKVESDIHWWPVGGAEITTDEQGKTYAVGDPVSTAVTSHFGYRHHPISGEYKLHTGVDLVGSGGQDNTYNIIASKSGIVTKVVNDCTNGAKECGGGYGGHVIISHADGNTTTYAHLAYASIIVEEGESVSQGQILGKMGTTGSSTGVHLHYEIRINGTPVDPLDFISAEYPRPTAMADSQLDAMLVCMEGAGPDDGESNYLVYDDGGGTLTVGAGVTLKWQKDKFSAHGIDVGEYSYVGAKIPKRVVDLIKSQILSEMYQTVNSTVTSNGINLQTHQIDALVSRKYNTGNITNFVSNYQNYGNTQGLYDNYMKDPVTMVGRSGVIQGLVNRRNYEWTLFHTGVYHTC